MKKILSAITLFFTFFAIAQEQNEKEKTKGYFFGGLESNAQWYTNDKERSIDHPIEPFRSNNYLNFNYSYGKFTAGIQGEAYEPMALLNYNPKYKDTDVATYYVNFTSNKLNITAGYFYEQFGSGLLLRTWEDRSLGINNALRGGRIKFTPNENMSYTLLYGRQRSGFEVSEGDIFGFDSEINISGLLNKDAIDLTFGASYVGRYEETYIEEPNFDEFTHAYAARINVAKNNFYLSTEYNYKTKDAILYNTQDIYNDFVKPGTAWLMNMGYSKKGMGIDFTFRRLENMNFFSEREPEVFAPEQTSVYFNDKMLNFLPSLTKQHHFLLANIYVYQAQAQVSISPDTQIAKAGEIGGQIDLYYDFAKGTKLGGQHGTKISFNASNYNNLKGDYDLFPPDYKTEFFGFGQKYFSDINLEVTKKFNQKFIGTFSYINQYYNNRYIAGAANVVVKTNILAGELDYHFTKGRAAKFSLEHMWADSDRNNWIAAMAEYNFNTRFSMFVFDMYNYGYEHNPSILIDDVTDAFDIHFYNVGAAYKKGSTRLAVNYGRQRGGLVCAGGVCRVVPPSTGLGISLNTSF